ncbi:MAG TPA: nitronate monooxygenase [Candidatus Polarisedimenticolaceae bacterium]|nr:nitronate monooxygenase [Candidatus Polarisedimenticolaceae bacterium]
MKLRTPLCDLLGISVPIVQSGMGTLAGAELAAAVSEAGGLGILGSAWAEPGALLEAIRQVRLKTRRPFGVNVLLPDELRPPLAPSTVTEAAAERVQAIANEARAQLRLPPRQGRPQPFPDLIPRYLEIVLEERVPVLSIGLGHPGAELIARCKERGIVTLAMVTTVEDARLVEIEGVDVVVAQGGEAGGHRSHFAKPPDPAEGRIGTLTLVPQVVDAVAIPVLAAGGIADGRGLAAVLALGAQGALMGTRFAATREAVAPEAYRLALVGARADDTVLTDRWTGRWARVIANPLLGMLSRTDPLPPYLQQSALMDVIEAAVVQGRRDLMPLYAGQGVGLIHDLPGAGEVVRRMVQEAQSFQTATR